jgi:hypothetical protein
LQSPEFDAAVADAVIGRTLERCSTILEWHLDFFGRAIRVTYPVAYADCVFSELEDGSFNALTGSRGEDLVELQAKLKNIICKNVLQWLNSSHPLAREYLCNTASKALRAWFFVLELLFGPIFVELRKVSWYTVQVVSYALKIVFSAYHTRNENYPITVPSPYPFYFTSPLL